MSLKHTTDDLVRSSIGRGIPERAPLDHSVFEADIHGQAMNVRYLGRILSWARPHRRIGLLSTALVLVAATLTVLLPVLIGRVVIDDILFKSTDTNAPDFGLTELTNWLANFLGVASIIAACVLFMIMTVACHGLYHAHRVLLSRTVLNALRDLRRDLFTHMARLSTIRSRWAE